MGVIAKKIPVLFSPKSGMVEQIPEGAIITKSGKYVVTMDGKYILTKSGFIPNNALKTNSGIPIVTTTGKYITI